MFWGIELEPSKPQTVTPKYPLHITKCILGSSATAEEKENARTIVKCQSGEENKTPYVIASLRLGAKEQTSLDLVFEPEVPIVLSTSGPSKVNLVGFYITSFDHDDEEDDFDDEEEFEEEEDEDEDDEDDEEDANLKALLRDEELDDDEEDFDPNEDEKANKEERMRDIIDDKIFKTELKAEKRQLKEKKEEEEEEEEEAPAKPSKKVQKVEKKAEKPQKAAKEPEKKQQQQQQQKKSTGYEPQKFSNGLIVQDIVVGKGAKPVRGHMIVMNYVGRLKNGKVFDSSSKANPFKFKFGVGQVIKGWDIGINGMQVGGKRKLTIPPSLGYGNQRVGPIPANSTLIFDVELLAVK